MSHPLFYMRRLKSRHAGKRLGRRQSARHSKAGPTLNWQEQNRNRTETLSTHMRQNADIFWMFQFHFALCTFNGQLQLSEYIMWRFKQNEEEDEAICMAAAGFIFLASKLSKEKKKRRFRVRPTLSKRKIYDGDELLMDLRNDDVGLSRELRSSFKNVFRMSSENFENFMSCWSSSSEEKYKLQTCYRCDGMLSNNTDISCNRGFISQHDVPV